MEIPKPGGKWSVLREGDLLPELCLGRPGFLIVPKSTLHLRLDPAIARSGHVAHVAFIATARTRPHCNDRVCGREWNRCPSFRKDAGAQSPSARVTLAVGPLVADIMPLQGFHNPGAGGRASCPAHGTFPRDPERQELAGSRPSAATAIDPNRPVRGTRIGHSGAMLLQHHGGGAANSI